MSYVSNKIFADFDKYVLKVMYESNEIIDMMIKTIEVKDGIINDLTEQVAYWTNLYRELKNAEGETK